MVKKQLKIVLLSESEMIELLNALTDGLYDKKVIRTVKEKLVEAIQSLPAVTNNYDKHFKEWRG